MCVGPIAFGKHSAEKKGLLTRERDRMDERHSPFLGASGLG
jgi:hypothetical protein